MEQIIFDNELIEDLRNKIMGCSDSEELEKLSAAYANVCKGQATIHDPEKLVDEEEKKFNRRVRIVELVLTGASTLAVFYGIWTGRQSNLDGIYAEEKLQKFVNNKFYHPIKTKF